MVGEQCCGHVLLEKLEKWDWLVDLMVFHLVAFKWMPLSGNLAVINLIMWAFPEPSYQVTPCVSISKVISFIVECFVDFSSFSWNTVCV